MGICFCFGTDYIPTNYGDPQGSVCNDLTLELRQAFRRCQEPEFRGLFRWSMWKEGARKYAFLFQAEMNTC